MWAVSGCGSSLRYFLIRWIKASDCGTADYRSLLAHCLVDRTTVVLLHNTGMSQSVLGEFAEQLLITPPPGMPVHA